MPSRYQTPYRYHLIIMSVHRMVQYNSVGRSGMNVWCIGAVQHLGTEYGMSCTRQYGAIWQTLMHGKTKEENISHLQQVMRVLCQEKLYINLKYSFMTSSVTFLGFVVSSKRLTLIQKKLKPFKSNLFLLLCMKFKVFKG